MFSSFLFQFLSSSSLVLLCSLVCFHQVLCCLHDYCQNFLQMHIYYHPNFFLSFYPLLISYGKVGAGSFSLLSVGTFTNYFDFFIGIFHTICVLSGSINFIRFLLSMVTQFLCMLSHTWIKSVWCRLTYI